MNFFKNYIKKHFPAFCLFVGLYLMSAAVGQYIALNIGDADFSGIEKYLSSQSFDSKNFEAFLKNGLSLNLTLFAVMAICYTSALFLPLGIAAVCFKALSVGFTAASIIRLGMPNAFLKVFISAILPAALKIPILMLMFVSCPGLSGQKTNSPSKMRSEYIRRLAMLFILCLVLCAICVLEAILSPLMK